MSGKTRDTVGEVEVDGEHVGDEDALPDAFVTAMARSIWWLYLPGDGGGGREKP